MVQSDKALQTQIRQLEALLKKPANNTCADCPGKTPRWASITFGTFVCLRCSGQHRALGVHITKIKSVNLDKWPEGKVEIFQALSNNLVNAYWEANLPANYQKPAQNANTSEVTRFLKEKYVEKRWVDTAMKYDPLYLFVNKRSRFDKFLQRVTNQGGGADDDSDEEPVRKEKKAKKTGQGRLGAAPAAMATAPAPARKAPAPQIQNQPDLISLAPAAPKDDNQFTDFISAAPAQQLPQDDGFSAFQGVNTTVPQNPMQQQQQPMPQQQNMASQQNQINNLLGMMSATTHTNPSTVKYAAFETMNDFDTPQQRMQKQQQLMQMQQMQQQQQQHQQQQQQQPANPFGMPTQQQSTQGASFQPQFFNSMQQQQQNTFQMGGNQMGGANPAAPQQQQQWQATFNTGGAQPQQPQQNAFGNQGGMGGMGGAQPNMFAGFQQQQQAQPSFNMGGGAQQPAFGQVNNGGFGGFQSAPQSMGAGVPQGNQSSGGNYYGGLVNLAPSAGNQQQSFGGSINPQQQQQQQQNMQQQNAAFGNLVKW